VRARLLLTTAIAATVLVGPALIATGTASASVRGASVRGVGPAEVYAPYFEAYLPDSVTAVTEQSGAKFVTLAFAQAAGHKGANACRLTWNGVASQPISKGGYLAGVKRLRAIGGDAIVSFGGYSADEYGTEIADACHSVKAIAAAYEQVVTVYGIDRLDMDVEANSLTNSGGINRRNKAITMLEHWAAARGIPLWIQFTLGVEPNGFDQPTMAILRNAIKNGTKINSINLMVFDYYLGTEKKPLNMGALAIRSALSVHRQLKSIYPSLSGKQIWRLLGFTMLPGIDDYPRKTEVTYLSDARVIMNFAEANRMDFLSIWALQRDNGRCPGDIDSNWCSGIRQPKWAFSHLLEPFTS
jgi:hypothetical protein